MKKLVLIVAVLFMLSAVSGFSQNRPKKFDKKQSGISALNLSDEQKDKVEELRLNHKKEMIDLKSELEKKELALKELKLKGDLSRSSYISAVKEISNIKNQIAEAQANHRMDVYEMLDDEQKDIWLKMDHRMDTRKDRMGMHRQHHKMN